MSRRLTFLIFLVLAAHAFGAPSLGTQSAKPVTASPVEQALQRARLLSRPAVVYFQMQGCSWCRRFESEVLSQDAVKQKLGDFEMIKVDIFDEKALAQQYGVRGAPAFVIVSASGEPVAKWTGFLDRDRFLKLLSTASAPIPDSDLAAEMAPEGGGPDVIVTPPVIAKLRKGPFADLSEEELAQFVLLGANAKTRSLCDEILQSQTLPIRPLVSLLRHQMLAVRLGTLQLLEDRAGETFRFDAWADDSSANAEALLQWEAWAAGSQAQKPATTDPELLAGHINELLNEDVVRSQRGFRALLRAGEAGANAASRFEEFNPALSPAQKARLKELRYAVALAALGVQDAEPLAHRLVFGNLDVRLQAMNTVAALGPRTLPILDAFLASSEPLEREAAVECVLRAGQGVAVPRIAALLKAETDSNVVHAALRKLGETGGDSTPALVETFVKDDNEDLSIAALECLGRLKASRSAPVILTALKDPRWRVRVAALKTAADLKLNEAAPTIRELLKDPDEFVRISAVEAASEMRLPNVEPIMEKLFIEQNALKPAIVQSYSRMSAKIPDSFIEALKKAPADVVLSVIGSVPDADAETLPLLQWAAGQKNEDIACAALRLVASQGLDEQANLDIIQEALLSGSQRKVQTALQSVAISRSKVVEGLPSADMVTFQGTAKPGSSLVDGIVQTFGGNTRTSKNKPALAPLASAIRNAKITDEADKLNAAIALAQLGDEAAAASLASKVPSLTSSQRARLAAALSVQRTEKNRALFEQLLNDTESEVRNETVSALFEDGANASCAALLFDTLQKPGSRLRPSEALHYRLTSRYSMKASAIPEYRAIYVKALQNASDPAIQVLALYLLGHAWDASCLPAVKPFLASDNPWLRRAAFFTLGRNDVGELRKNRDQIVSDTSPYVRAVYPASFISESFYWKTHFSDTEYESTSEDNLSSTHAALDKKDEEIIRKLMDDSDTGVQTLAGMSLFTHVLPFDTAKFFALIKRDPNARYLAYTFRNIFQKNLDRMPDEYARLVPLMSDVDDDQLQKRIEKRFPADESLAAISTPSPSPAAVVVAAVSTPPSVQPVANSTPAPSDVQLVYFSKPGCSHCARVKSMLARVTESFPELKVVEFNINKNQSMELNESLSRRFGVPENLRLVAPAVFTSAGYLVNDDIAEERVGDLILRAKEPGNRPLEVEAAATADSPAAAQAIAERYARINPGLILSAGVLDGLNPCAFATIIFLLSYLQVARKTPREMAQIGIAYVAGVFSAYFLLGLGLSELVAKIMVFRWAALVLNVSMGIFALVIAILSFRDGIRCLQGRLQDMSLQLPGFLKDRIRTVIRKSVPHRGFVLAAFGVGAFISLLELACTGQVYAPTILYMIQAGKGGAVGYLLLYNLAFILPLTVVFVLAFFGLTSGKLTTFLQRHAAVVKFGMALLFFVLAFVLFAREWHG